MDADGSVQGTGLCAVRHVSTGSQASGGCWQLRAGESSLGSVWQTLGAGY